MSYTHITQNDMKRLQEELEKVEDEDIGLPQGTYKEGRTIVKYLIDEVILPRMKEFVAEKFYAGSAYEHVQAGKLSDYDIQFFAKLEGTKPTDWVVRSEERNKWSQIKYVGTDLQEKTQVQEKYLNREDYLCANKVMEFFNGKIKGALESHGGRYDHGITSVKLGMAGPANKLKVEWATGNKLEIDIVTTVFGKHVGDADRDFVAKPPKNQDIELLRIAEHNNGTSWRSSFSQQEKEKFSEIDSTSSSVHRTLTRIMKVICRKNDKLKIYPSYLYKNLMLHVSDKIRDQKKWTHEYMAARFVNMLCYLCECFAKKDMRVYFNRKDNLLQFEDKEKIAEVVSYLTVMDARGGEGYINFVTNREQTRKRKLTTEEPV